jgi:hypothetical protein
MAGSPSGEARRRLRGQVQPGASRSYRSPIGRRLVVNPADRTAGVITIVCLFITIQRVA